MSKVQEKIKINVLFQHNGIQNILMVSAIFAAAHFVVMFSKELRKTLTYLSRNSNEVLQNENSRNFTK